MRSKNGAKKIWVKYTPRDQPKARNTTSTVKTVDDLLLEFAEKDRAKSRTQKIKCDRKSIFASDPTAPEVFTHIGSGVYAAPGEQGETRLWHVDNPQKSAKPIPPDCEREMLTTWLKDYKKQTDRKHCPWRETIKAIGISHRTWDGWMQRPVPFFRLAKMLLLLKQIRRTDSHSRTAHTFLP